MIEAMPPRITLVFLVASFGLNCVASGQSPAEGKESQMMFRLIQVPESVFSTVDTTEKDGIGKPKPGVQRVKAAETLEYDVTAFLKPYGVAFPPGSMAVYLEPDCILVLRNTGANLDLLSGIFPNSHSQINSNSLAVELSAYECTFAGTGNLLPWAKLTYSDLQNLPRGSVKLIDRTSLVKIPGVRTLTSHINTPAAAGGPQVDAALFPGGLVHFQPGETGAIMEMVACYQDGGGNIETDYQMRTGLESTGAIYKVHFNTSFGVWDDYPAVIHVSPVLEQPGKYVVVVARAGRDNLNAWKMPEPKSPQPVSTPQEPGVSGGGLPPGMAVAAFRVPPGFLIPTNSPSLLVPGESAPPPAAPQDPPPKPIEPQEFLKQAGVDFPPASVALFDRQMSELIVVNTPQNLDLVDCVVSSGLGKGRGELVLVEISVFKFSFPPKTIIRNLERFTFSDLERLPADSVKLLGCCSVVTKPYERAIAIQSAGGNGADESKYKEGDVAWKLLKGETGTELEVEATQGRKPDEINLGIGYTLRTPPDKDDGKTTDLNIVVTAQVADDEPVVLRVLPAKDDEEKYVAIVARIKRVNYGGWPFKN